MNLRYSANIALSNAAKQSGWSIFFSQLRTVSRLAEKTIALCILALTFTSDILAESSTDWYYRAWQTDDGLPSATVNGIFQNKEGYLLLGTLSGLVRFDGVKFEEIPVPLGRSRPLIRTMLYDHLDTLWIAQDGGIIVRLNSKSTNATLFTSVNGLPDLTPIQMVETGDHSVWISYPDGSVFSIDAVNKVSRYSPTNELPGREVASMTVDINGQLWCAKSGLLAKYSGGHFVETGGFLDHPAQWLASKDGGFWICTSTKLRIC